MTKFETELYVILTNGEKSDKRTYAARMFRKTVFIPFVPITDIKLEIDGKSYLIEDVTYVYGRSVFRVELEKDKRPGLPIYNENFEYFINEYTKNGWELINSS